MQSLFLFKEKSENAKDIWHNFLEDSTFHGLQNTFHRSTRPMRRCFWAILLSGMIAITTLTIVNTIKIFFKRDVLIRIDTETEKEVYFPSITICNIFSYSFDKLSARFPSMLPFYGELSSLDSYDSPELIAEAVRSIGNTTIFDFYRGISQDLDDLFISCRFNSNLLNCTDFVRDFYTDFSHCFTFNALHSIAGAKRLKQTLPGFSETLSLTLNLNPQNYTPLYFGAHGSLMYLHEPEEYPNMASGSFFVAGGYDNHIGITKTVHKRLKKPNSSIGCAEKKHGYYSKDR